MFRTLPLVALLAFPTLARADASAVVGKDAIEFKSGDAVAARYQYAGTVPDEKGKGQKPLAKPVLWPLHTPAGAPVTGFAPSDHVHHKSVWFCHGDVIPEGVELKVKAPNKRDKGVDFWSEVKNGNGEHGVIKCVKVGEPKSHGAGHVSVETHNEWLAPEGLKIMDEVRVIHFIDGKEGRTFAFDITLKANDFPITFGDTKEGSFGVRVHEKLRPADKAGATLTTADGKTIAPPAKDNLPFWGQPSEWVDYSGALDGKAVGIAVFDHPGNPKASWHARAYGLVGANPFGRAHSGFPSQKDKTDLLKIEKGGEMKLKYAVYAHDGDVKAGKVSEAYEAFKK